MILPAWPQVGVRGLMKMMIVLMRLMMNMTISNVDVIDDLWSLWFNDFTGSASSGLFDEIDDEYDNNVNLIDDIDDSWHYHLIILPARPQEGAMLIMKTAIMLMRSMMKIIRMMKITIIWWFYRLGSRGARGLMINMTIMLIILMRSYELFYRLGLKRGRGACAQAGRRKFSFE